MCFLCFLQGLASCFGICAINHLEETLAKLEDFVKSDVFKKSVGLFSIFKVRAEGPPPRRSRRQEPHPGFFSCGVCWSRQGEELVSHLRALGSGLGHPRVPGELPWLPAPWARVPPELFARGRARTSRSVAPAGAGGPRRGLAVGADSGPLHTQQSGCSVP